MLKTHSCVLNCCVFMVDGEFARLLISRAFGIFQRARAAHARLPTWRSKGGIDDVSRFASSPAPLDDHKSIAGGIRVRACISRLKANLEDRLRDSDTGVTSGLTSEFG